MSFCACVLKTIREVAAHYYHYFLISWKRAALCEWICQGQNHLKPKWRKWFLFLKLSTHNLARSEVRTYTKILVGQCPNLGIWAKQFQFGFALGKNLYNSVLLMENILDFFGWFERLSCYVVTIGKISRHIKIRVPSINPLFLSKSVLRSRKREYFLLFLNLRLFFYPDRPTYRAWSCDGRFSSSLCSISSKLSIGFPCFFHSLCLNSVLPQSAFPEVDFL